MTVKSATETVDGPQGPISGAMLVEEMLMDGVLEDKTFAPGYGEFMAQPEVDPLTTASAEIYTAAGASDRAAITTLLNSLTTAWNSYRGTEFHR